MNIYKLIIGTLFLLTSISYCKSQNCKNSYIIKHKMHSYIIRNIEINNWEFEIHNYSNEVLWVWFDENQTESNIEVKIRKHFFNNSTEVNLYQIGMDHNIESFIPDLFSSFTKPISPQESFFIRITNNLISNKSEKMNIHSLFNQYIVICKEKDLIKVIPDINSMNKIIFYREKGILIPIDGLVQNNDKVKNQKCYFYNRHQ